MLAERLDDASGRRWRYAFPLPRVALAAVLLFAGVVCAIAAIATRSLALIISAALTGAPGAWATHVYVTAYRGGVVQRPDVFFEVVELD